MTSSPTLFDAPTAANAERAAMTAGRLSAALADLAARTDREEARRQLADLSIEVGRALGIRVWASAAAPDRTPSYRRHGALASLLALVDDGPHGFRWTGAGAHSWTLDLWNATLDHLLDRQAAPALPPRERPTPAPAPAPELSLGHRERYARLLLDLADRADPDSRNLPDLLDRIERALRLTPEGAPA